MRKEEKPQSAVTALMQNRWQILIFLGESISTFTSLTTSVNTYKHFGH
jgi:hypothetical protein